MSNIYMLQKEIHFYRFTQSKNIKNRLIQEDVITFPTNIIQCSLTISGLDGVRCDFEGTIPKQRQGGLGFFGAGIEDISCVGTQVYFLAWLQFLQIDNDGDSRASFLQNASYLLVQAIAECE